MPAEAILYCVFIGTFLFPVIYGMLVYLRITPSYRPMLVFVWTVFVFHVLTFFFQLNFPVAKIIRHLKPMLELGLIAWQAKRLRIFDKHPKFFRVLIILVIAFGYADYQQYDDLQARISWFSIASSFLITLIAIELLNRTMITGTAPIFRNTTFLFSVALIFYYTFCGLLEIFMLMGQFSGTSVLYKSYYFYIALGITTNIIYLSSFLCIPRKTNYFIS